MSNCIALPPKYKQCYLFDSSFITDRCLRTICQQMMCTYLYFWWHFPGVS